MNKPRTQPKIERPRQETPAELVNDLLGVIRNQFYADAPEKQWFQDQNFLKVNVVLWPAEWLNEKALRLPPARYKAILMDIFDGVKVHGQTGAVKFWPGYLMKCVQSHFGMHTEEIKAEAEAIRTKVDVNFFAFGKLELVKEDKTSDVLAEARKLMIREKKEKQKAKAKLVAETDKMSNLLSRPGHKPKAKTQAQGELF